MAGEQGAVHLAQQLVGWNNQLRQVVEDLAVVMGSLDNAPLTEGGELVGWLTSIQARLAELERQMRTRAVGYALIADELAKNRSAIPPVRSLRPPEEDDPPPSSVPANAICPHCLTTIGECQRDDNGAAAALVAIADAEAGEA